MEEKDKNQKGEELIEVDEKGKSVEKKEEKKPAPAAGNFTHVLAIFLALVLLGLFLRIFIFNKNTEKTKNYHKYKTPEDLFRNVGEAIIRFIKQKPKAKIGLTYGRAPEELYKYLIRKYEKGEISFKDVQFFSIDGFCGLSKSDPNSYHYSLTTNFLDYNKLLEENPIDLLILSFGENGHIGFNEPNTDFELLTHVVELTPEKREEKSKIFGSLDKTPQYAITQGVRSVLQAKEVIAIAKGKGKAQAVSDLVNGVYTKKSPITALRNHNGKVTVCTDEEAGSKIKEINKLF